MAAPFLNQHCVRHIKNVGNLMLSPRHNGRGKSIASELRECSVDRLLELKEEVSPPGNRYYRKLVNREIARRKKLGTWVW